MQIILHFNTEGPISLGFIYLNLQIIYCGALCLISKVFSLVLTIVVFYKNISALSSTTFSLIIQFKLKCPLTKGGIKISKLLILCV